PYENALQIDNIANRKLLSAKTPNYEIHKDSGMTATVVALLTVCCAFVSAAYRPSSEGGPPDAPYKLSYADYKKTWENYKVTFGKKNKNEAEERKRFAVSMENVDFVEYHNWKYHNNGSSFYLDINQFTDLVKALFLT
ncbi:cathepsin l, partial [Plakobranchus ocellatus]